MDNKVFHLPFPEGIASPSPLLKKEIVFKEKQFDFKDMK